jgi:uncharacterized membrane protein YdfJ with MMPL/SSD domain
VVTAAALIMTAAFGAFILDKDPVVKSIGLSLAVGVLIDAFVVRMTLVPAVMAARTALLVAPAPPRPPDSEHRHRGATLLRGLADAPARS